MILFTPDELRDLRAGLQETIEAERQKIIESGSPEYIAEREAIIARAETLTARIDLTLKAVKSWDGSDAAWCGLIREAAETALEATATAAGRNPAFAEVVNRMDEELMP